MKKLPFVQNRRFYLGGSKKPFVKGQRFYLGGKTKQKGGFLFASPGISLGIKLVKKLLGGKRRKKRRRRRW